MGWFPACGAGGSCGCRGGTAAHGMDHVLAGICAVSIAEKHSVSIAVCYRYFMHMEAPIKNKNILKPVKKKIVQILLLVCFSGDVWLSHGVDPSRS